MIASGVSEQLCLEGELRDFGNVLVSVWVWVFEGLSFEGELRVFGDVETSDAQHSEDFPFKGELRDFGDVQTSEKFCFEGELSDFCKVQASVAMSQVSFEVFFSSISSGAELGSETVGFI